MSAPTLIDNLNQIASIKSDIKSAIENKGVDMTGLSFADYPGAISSIQTGGTFVTETLNVSVNNTYYPGQGVDGFSQVVVDVPQSVTGFTEKDLTEKTIPLINISNSASFVASEVFLNESTIQTVNLPNCVSVFNGGFSSCRYLREISLPVCSYIGSYAFANCSVLSELNLPSCTSINQTGFGYCSVLSELNLPVCSYIGSYAFVDCSGLNEVYLPACNLIGTAAFSGCRTLSSVNIPECLIISSQAFGFCPSLQSISAPILTYIGSSVFAGGWASSTRNYLLSELNFPFVYLVYSNAFAGLESVHRVNLPIVSYCEAFISNTYLEEVSYGNMAYYVPRYNSSTFSTFSGSIYVDAAMYDRWVSHSQWGSLSSLFVSSGDATIPMISVDANNRLYGKTMILEGQWSWTSITGITNISITSIDLPNCKYYSCMLSVSTLQTISLPECEVFSGYVNGAYIVSDVYLPKCKKIVGNSNGRLFYECKNLNLILGGSSVCSIYENGNNFNIIWPLSSLSGIYVPSSLVDAYKSAYGWSQYSDYIFPISE